jgi:DNA repair photolyase
MPGSFWQQMETRRVILALGEAGLWPQTMVLTKNPRRALETLNGLGAGPDGLWFGTSLTSLSSELTKRYEPGVEDGPIERLRALRDAVVWGYKTWTSVEPPLPGALLVSLVAAIRATQTVKPWVMLGKMNYRNGSDERLRQWSQSAHWGLDRDEVVRDLVELSGYQESLTPKAWGYWVKRELRVWGTNGSPGNGSD